MHQPHRLVKYSVFNIGKNKDYFLDLREVIEVVAKTCYIPSLKLMLDLIDKNNENFKFSLCITGSTLELFEKYSPLVIDLLKKLIKTNQVELISTTYYNTLSSIYSLYEFERQIKNNNLIIQKILNKKPRVFMDTNGIYNSSYSNILLNNGFNFVIVDGRILKNPCKNNGLTLIPYNFELSDKINNDFSNKEFKDYPINIDKFSYWLNLNDNKNLCFDIEILGEIHKVQSGIFKFFEHLPKILLNNYRFIHISDFSNINENYSSKDFNYSLNNLLANKMQKEIFNYISLYPYEDLDNEIVNDIGKLQDITNLKNMEINNFNKHSPYELFISYMNILKDLNLRLENKKLKMINKV
jgi:alpha-amylase